MFGWHIDFDYHPPTKKINITATYIIQTFVHPLTLTQRFYIIRLQQWLKQTQHFKMSLGSSIYS